MEVVTAPSAPNVDVDVVTAHTAASIATNYMSTGGIIAIALAAAAVVMIIGLYIYAKFVAAYMTPTDTPIGTIIPYAGTVDKVPAGWILCNGAAYDPGTYAELFALIKYTYGQSGINFMVPDARGVFLRGADSGAARDPGRVIGTLQLSGTTPVIGATATSAGTGW